MKLINKIIHRLDILQQRHRLAAFVYAVIKKYGEDNGGYQAALLTYYGFLALFPLLLVLTTLTTTIAGSHSHLQSVIIKGTTSYFPVLGSQLSSHVHTLHKNGLALVIGIVLTLYGTRGVAGVFVYSVQRIWRVPKEQIEGFPKSLLKSLAIIIVGSVGFVAAAVSSGLTAAAGHGLAFRLLSIAVDLFVLFWLFTFLLNISLPRRIAMKNARAGAATAAIGLVVLQSLGSFLLTRELKSLDALYSYFAIALGLLFWIYLQAQLLYYAVEVAAVRAHKLWPRSLSDQK